MPKTKSAYVYGPKTDYSNNVDPVADLIFANPAGYLLFYFDNVAEFCSETLGMNSWQMMPSMNPLTGELANI